MRKDLSRLLTKLLDGLRDAEMGTAAKAMGVSKATAYRYREAPLNMPLKSFVGLVEHLKLPLDLSVTLHQEELIEAEALRLRFEKRVAREVGYRIVTTPHFTVNCEIPEFTEAKFRTEYPEDSWHLIEEYLELRQERRDLYLSGSYRSIEVINGAAYLDFFLKRNVFDGVSDDIWRRQHAEIIESLELSHINRYIYLKSTPELPVILCYSCGKTILRFDDITIGLSEDHFLQAKNTLENYKENCKYKEKRNVRDFLINPIRVGA